MALETGDYISDLVPTNPTGADARRLGDDHIRLIKDILQKTFPNLDGPVTATPAELNKSTDTTLDFPVGGIILWSGLVADVPAGWAFCDGTNGTPNLTNRFVIGADGDSGGTSPVAATGGSRNTSASNTEYHTLTAAEIPAHSHTYSGTFANNYDRDQGGSGFQSGGTRTTNENTGGGGGHRHGIPSITDGRIPPYFALAYIMKL